jgi:TPR repeat protein
LGSLRLSTFKLKKDKKMNRKGKKMNQKKRHGRCKESNGQHSASRKPFNLETSIFSNTAEIEEECDAELLFQAGVQWLGDPQHSGERTVGEELLKLAAQQGHVRAQVHLANILTYESCYGECQHLVIATKLFRSAAEKGDAEAMFGMGIVLRQENGPEYDPIEATKWFEKSASFEFPTALARLGAYYLDGEDGYTKDVDKALEMLKKAQQKGDVTAPLILGTLYLQGSEVTRDIDLAVKFLKVAAEGGVSSPCSHLGSLHVQSHVVSNVKSEAARLLLMAAECGHKEAQFAIGMMYKVGDVLPKDVNEAAYWLGENDVLDE